MMGHPGIKQTALGRQPVPRSLSSPSGNSIFWPISPGSRLRVPGFDSRPSPVIMWLPGKEGSRRNWLLCLAPLQEVFLLGGTKVRAGWEAFPNSSPHTCPSHGRGTRDPPHRPGSRVAFLVPIAQNTLHGHRRCVVPPARVFGGERTGLQPLCEMEHLQIFLFPHGRKEGAAGGSIHKRSKRQGLQCRKRLFTLFL